ncbi:MAG: hypothetical protein JWN70_5815 [Planctomycetaceae bacterium]|nr:hypothetical protein [Planctomycetaceae bacterium]
MDQQVGKSGEHVRGADRDAIVAQEVTLALRNIGYRELHKLKVTVDSGNVGLYGRVPNYFLKQKAECAARDVPNVATLRSDIEVARAN